MQCNIDAIGKAFRLKMGIMTLISGIALTILYIILGINQEILWIVPAGIVGGGLFSIFEGWAGWCVVRAMGFTTPH